LGRPQVSYAKRQREQAKREKRQLKAEKRALRKSGEEAEGDEFSTPGLEDVADVDTEDASDSTDEQPPEGERQAATE
jgi:sRNA-binding protein